MAYSEGQYKKADGALGIYGPYADLRDKVVLDAGCGPGGKTVRFAEYGCKLIIGVDSDELSIKHARDFALRRQPQSEFHTAASMPCHVSQTLSM